LAAILTRIRAYSVALAAKAVEKVKVTSTNSAAAEWNIVLMG